MFFIVLCWFLVFFGKLVCCFGNKNAQNFRIFYIEHTFDAKLFCIFYIEHTFDAKLFCIIFIEHTFEAKIFASFFVTDFLDKFILHILFIEHYFESKILLTIRNIQIYWHTQDLNIKKNQNERKVVFPSL